MQLDGETTVEVSQTPGPKGTYETGTLVTMEVKNLDPCLTVDWRGALRVIGEPGLIATVQINDETFITMYFPRKYIVSCAQ